MSKLVFLHSSVDRETDLVSSFLDECVVHQVTSESNLESFDVSGLSHVAFVWHYPGYNSLPFFGDDVHVSDPESNQEPERPEYHYFSNKVVAWMKTLPSGCKVDLLSCNLSGDDYASEVATLEGVCDVDIRYSVDQTGNNPSGNWVLESDGVDVRDVYFSESVLAWNGILAKLIKTDVFESNVTESNIGSYFSYDSETKTLKLLQNIDNWSKLMSDSGYDNTYFIQLESDETFDGQGFTINLYDITGWAGLFACSGGSADVRAKIMNLGVLNGTTANFGGFIIRQLQQFFEVENCYSTGSIGFYAGGICGNDAGKNGSCVVSNCYSTGSIGNNAGGICGQRAGSFSGSCIVSNCYSTGTIGSSAGGICGTIAGGSSLEDPPGSCFVSNCYSTGEIIGTNAGGICGSYVGFNGSCVVSNCYSAGEIIGTNAGGICGNNGGGNAGLCLVSNCYSNRETGNIIGGKSDGIKAMDGTSELDVLSLNKGAINSTNAVELSGTTYLTYGTGSIDSFVDVGATYPILRGNINTDVTGDVTIGYTLTFSSVNPGTGYVPLQIITESNQTISITNENVNAIVMTKNSDSNEYFSNPTSAYFGNPEDAFKQLFTLIDPSTESVSISKTALGLESTNVDNYDVYKVGGTIDTSVAPTNGIYVPLSNVGDSVTINDSIITVSAVDSTTGYVSAFTKDGSALAEIVDATNGNYYDIGGYKWYKGSLYTNGEEIDYSINPAALASSSAYFDYADNTLSLNQNVTWQQLINEPNNGVISEQSYITLASDETFDGQGFTIDLGDITEWQGLFACDGGSADPVVRAKIMNLGVLNGTTSHYGGFIVRKEQKFFEVENCYSTGSIGNFAGGICGSNAGYDSGSCIVSNCYSRGNIGYVAGGICGYAAGQSDGSCIVRNCYSTGSMGEFAGGICGPGAGQENGSCAVSNCYSTGDITNSSAGGICGSDAGKNGSCEVSNCYSTGSISNKAGGICGNNAGQTNGSCIVSNCYSTGSIGTNDGGGGICGNNAGKDGSCVVSNCYSTGSICSYAGGICGTNAGFSNGSCVVSNCYSTGSIGADAGGICGINTGISGSCVVSNCYSTGSIGTDAGGICGSSAGNGGSCIVSNCYSTGSIGSDAGGICGSSAGFSTGSCIVRNCYSNDGTNNLQGGTGDGTKAMDGTSDLTVLNAGAINSSDAITINDTTYVTYNTNSIDSFVNLETDYPVLRGNINTDVTGDVTSGYTLTLSSVDPGTGYVPLQIITDSTQTISTSNENINVNAVVMTKDAPNDQYFNDPNSAYFGNPEDAFKQLFTLIDPNTISVSISKTALGLGNTNVDNYDVYRLGSEEASFTENQALETTDNGLYFPLYNENDSVTLNDVLLVKTSIGFSYGGNELSLVAGKTYYNIGGLKWYAGSIYTDGTLIPVIPVTLSVLVNESTGVSVDNAYKVLLSAQEYTLPAFKSTFFRYGRFRYDRNSSTPLPDLANTSNAYTIKQSGTEEPSPPDNAFDFIAVAMNHFETQQTASNDVSRDTWSTISYMSITKQLLQYKTMDNWNFLSSNSYTYSELETVYQEEKGEAFGVGSLVGISFVIANDAMNPLEIIVPIQIVADPVQEQEVAQPSLNN